MATPFDRIFLGDIVTSGRVLRDGYVAVRGEAIAATVLRGETIWDSATVLAQPGTGRFIRRTTH